MSKSNKKNTKTAARPFQVMCTDLYLLWILIAFPLYYADGYFHLPENKSIFWCTSTLVYLGVTLFGVVITALSMREYWSFENFKKNITMTDVFMFGFLICNLIALAISDDKMNSWTGQSSRYYGAKVLILVCLVYFMVSRYGWMNKVFIWAFLIGGNGVCLLATFDYFGMDVLGINQQMREVDQWLFISTMGNANTCASYVSMAVAASWAYYCFTDLKNNRVEKLLVAISVLNCTVALSTAKSDSATVGVGIVLIALIILMFKGIIKWKNILELLILVLGTLTIFSKVRETLGARINFWWLDNGIPKLLWEQGKLIGLMFFVCVILYILLLIIEKRYYEHKKKILKKLAIGFLSVSIVFVSIYLMYKFELITVFKEGMGYVNEATVGSRSYTYKRVLQAYIELPTLNKLFGCGQASMTSLLYQYFGEELSAAGISINSAHNNILDYLIITGFCGVVCYLGTIVFAVKHVYSAVKENKNALIFGLIVVAYFAQGIFNIDQTTTTTVFWLMIGCCEAVYRENVVKKNR